MMYRLFLEARLGMRRCVISPASSQSALLRLFASYLAPLGQVSSIDGDRGAS